MARGGNDFHITGLEELNARIIALGKPAMQKKIWRPALRAGARIVQKEVKALVPKDEGDLKRSIKVRAAKRDKKNKDVVSILVLTGGADQLGIRGSAYYPMSQEAGWMDKGGKRHPGKPYMRPGKEKAKGRARAAIARKGGEQLEKEAKKLKGVK